MKRCLSLWIYGWLGKTKSHIATWERLFLQSLKYGRYCTDTHTKGVCKDFETENLGEYHDLHVKSDTVLLADVFGNFRNMCLEIYEVDPAKFLWAPGLACQAALKKIKLKLPLLTDIDMIFMVEKGIRGEICHSIYKYEQIS